MYPYTHIHVYLCIYVHTNTFICVYTPTHNVESNVCAGDEHDGPFHGVARQHDGAAGRDMTTHTHIYM